MTPAAKRPRIVLAIPAGSDIVDSVNELRRRIMAVAAGDERVRSVRAFNRFYTRIIGVLEEGLLRSPYSLTEARVIFELAQREATEVASLRRELELDAGYLSRILARLEADGLAVRRRSAEDGRRQVIRLTEAGRAAFATLDARSAEEARALLDGLGEEGQRRLLTAMATVRDVLDGGPAERTVLLRAPQHGDLGWVVARHGALYAREYGWDATFEGLVARIVGEFAERADAVRERGWIAEVDGEPAGCVFCMRRDDEVAQLRLLLVEPSARGLGIGTRLVDACVDFARDAGYRRMTLWTNDVLVDARRIYERARFVLGEEGRHRSFGADLVEQTWWKDLEPPEAGVSEARARPGRRRGR
jgi:DNA-binding MarR family transcriptional regulator/GNAT superfamily N-acetyltransferase